jgi:hypothetical protein
MFTNSSSAYVHTKNGTKAKVYHNKIYSLEIFRFVRVFRTCCIAFVLMHNQMMLTWCAIVKTILTWCAICSTRHTCFVLVICNERNKKICVQLKAQFNIRVLICVTLILIYQHAITSICDFNFSPCTTSLNVFFFLIHFVTQCQLS